MTVAITKQPHDAIGADHKELTTDETVDLITAATGTAPLTFTWKNGTTTVPGATSSAAGAQSTLKVTMNDDGTAAGTYVCTVTEAGGGDGTPTEPVTITKKQPAPAGSPEEPVGSLVFDSPFANTAAQWIVIGGFAVVVVLALGGLIAFNAKVNSPDEGTWRALSSMIIALGLLIVGVLISCGALYVLVVEMRGRMRKEDDAKALVAMGAAGALSADTLKAAADVINALGKVRAAIAALIIACVPLIGAAWIGVAAADHDTKPPTTSSSSAPPSDSGSSTDSGSNGSGGGSSSAAPTSSGN